MQLEPFIYELLSDDHKEDVDFGDALQQLKDKTTIDMEGNEYHFQDGILQKLGKLCITLGKENSLDEEVRYFLNCLTIQCW